MKLVDINVLYRRPELYDNLAGQDGTKTDAIRHVVKRYGAADVRTVLDLGCGTGIDLAELATTYGCVGVDVQAQMIRYGRQVRPHLDLRVGDLLTVRLGARFDVIACVGNTLAYVKDDAALKAAFATFAAHARPGTLLVIQTLGAPVPTGSCQASNISVGGVHAEVVTRTEWQPGAQLSVMHRRWRFGSGDEAVDRIERRVTSPSVLEQLMRGAGFEPVAFTGDPSAQPPRPPAGPSVWAIGRYEEWLLHGTAGLRLPPRIASGRARVAGHAAQPPELTAAQERIRLRVCSAAATLHDRLVALADVRSADSADKEAVRGWLFANQPDQTWKPAARKVPQWTGD